MGSGIVYLSKWASYKKQFFPEWVTFQLLSFLYSLTTKFKSSYICPAWGRKGIERGNNRSSLWVRPLLVQQENNITQMSVQCREAKPLGWGYSYAEGQSDVGCLSEPMQKRTPKWEKGWQRRDSLHTERMNKQVNLRKPMGATFLSIKVGYHIWKGSKLEETLRCEINQ